MGSTFHKGKWVTRYGLTCGFWSNSGYRLDDHVMAHVREGKADELYDLMASQYQGEKLNQCKDGVS